MICCLLRYRMQAILSVLNVINSHLVSPSTVLSNSTQYVRSWNTTPPPQQALILDTSFKELTINQPYRAEPSFRIYQFLG